MMDMGMQPYLRVGRVPQDLALAPRVGAVHTFVGIALRGYRPPSVLARIQPYMYRARIPLFTGKYSSQEPTLHKAVSETAP